jgi:type IV secretory pathway VirB2 component (pilin)
MNFIQSSRTAMKRVGVLRKQVASEATSRDADRMVTVAPNAESVPAPVARRHRQFAAWTTAASLSLICGAARAADMTASFSAIDKILQGFVTFMTGPFGKAAVVISIVAAFVTWVFAPKEGIFGPVLRVVVAGVAILNAATFITNFTI